jgi:hypothetical protein
MLQQLGHPQPPTPIQTNNLTAYGVINNEIQPKATKAMNMCFYWLKDRESVEQFKYHWRLWRLLDEAPSTTSPPISMRPLILNNPKMISILSEAIKKKAMTVKAA